MKFSHHSPNFDYRPPNTPIDTIVLHHTNMATNKLALDRLCDSKAKVSAHYLIARSGEIYMLVEETKRAWHAGKSYWRGKDALNDNSIGIELDNSGMESFSHIQMQSLIKICHEIMTRFPIEARNVIGHFDIAPDRKDDPNHLFDWKLLAQHNIGLYPLEEYMADNSDLYVFGDSGEEIRYLQIKLASWGYPVDVNYKFDIKTEDAIKAFKRHFCSKSYLEERQMIWDKEAEYKLNALLSMVDGKN